MGVLNIPTLIPSCNVINIIIVYLHTCLHSCYTNRYVVGQRPEDCMSNVTPIAFNLKVSADVA